MISFSCCFHFSRLTPLCSSRKTANCLAIVRLHKRKVFVGFAQTRNPLKRVDLNFKLLNCFCAKSIILIIYLIIKLKCNILCNNKNILLLLFQDSIIEKNGVFTDKNSKNEKEELKWIKTMAQSMMPANLANQR